MVRFVLAEVERQSNDPLPIAERELDELSYIEEQLIAKAIENGEVVHRRGDAPPAAVLQVRIVQASRAAA